jgi:hypothetical protein
MLRALIILLLLPIVSEARVKSSRKNPETYTVYINYPGHSVRANVLHGPAKIRPRTGFVYHWYSDNDIKETDGGFDGRLLHGEYKSFYLDKNLREQGTFRHGLKEDEWKTWFPGGRLHELAYYKKGKLHGNYERYDENGNLEERSVYKNGVKHGRSISYRNGKEDTTIIYRHGRTKIKAPKLITGNVNVKSDTAIVAGAQDTTVNTPKSRFRMKKVVNNEEKQEGKGLQKDKKKAGEEGPKKKVRKPKEKTSTETPSERIPSEKKKRGSRVKKKQPPEDQPGANPS